MSFEKLQKEVKAGTIYPVYLFHGEESLMIDQAASFLEEKLLQEHEKAFDQVILYGMDHTGRQILEQLMLFPLLGPRRVVFVREAQQVEDIKDLEVYVQRPAGTSVLVLCYKGKSLDKRLKLYEAIKQKGFILAADQLKGKEVMPWVIRTAASMNVRLDNEAASAIVELIGEEVSLLYPELKKLSISHGDGKAVTSTDIIDLVGLSREYNVFELQNALEAGNIPMTMRIGSRMAEQKGYSIIPLIALLFGFYSRTLAAKSSGATTDAAIGEAIGNKSPFLINKTKDAMRKFSIEHLENCISWLHIYDMKSKGWGNPGADDRALTIELLDHLLIPTRVGLSMSQRES